LPRSVEKRGIQRMEGDGGIGEGFEGDVGLGFGREEQVLDAFEGRHKWLVTCILRQGCDVTWRHGNCTCALCPSFTVITTFIIIIVVAVGDAVDVGASDNDSGYELVVIPCEVQVFKTL
jgi:hypothetical protein